MSRFDRGFSLAWGFFLAIGILLSLVAERRSWVGEGRTDLDPIPWAEAIPKEGESVPEKGDG